MREMWQLPKQSAWRRLWRVVQVVALVWAVVAVPVTVWLSLRVTPAPPPPERRPLTVIEEAAVRYAAQTLRTTSTAVTETVTTPLAQLRVEQTFDPLRGVSTGTVHSGSQTAELLAVGGRVLLRGNAPFWSSVGVPTAETGWVEVDDRLGMSLLYPLTRAAGALTTDPKSTVTGSPAAAVTFRNGSVTATFSSDGLTSVTVGDRTATVNRPTDAALAKLAASPPPGWDAVPPAVLSGGGGVLVVTPPAPPAPPASPAPAPAERNTNAP